MNVELLPTPPLSNRQAATAAQRLSWAIQRKHFNLFLHDELGWIDTWFDWYMQYCRTYTHALTATECEEMHEYFHYHKHQGVTGDWPSSEFIIDGRYVERSAPMRMLKMERMLHDTVAPRNVTPVHQQCEDLLHALREWRQANAEMALIHSGMIEAVIWRCGCLGFFSTNWNLIKDKILEVLKKGEPIHFTLSMREPGTTVLYELSIDLKAAIAD